MRLLALASATRRGGAALLDDAAGIRTSVEFAPPTTGGAGLLPAALECLNETGLTPADLDGLVVCGGPGSFTGLRVGLAVTLGLAETHRLPVYAPGSLEVLRWSARGELEDDEAVRVLLGAGRGLVFTRAFHGASPAGPPELLTLEELAARPAAATYLGAFPADWSAPPGSRRLSGYDWIAPLALADLGRVHLNEGRPIPLEELKPLYLKAPAARPLVEKG
ncbi:MAG: tRNA (adenosine(37)-N6)-threonylcarbamoyltransferase complex dimerization subunit type 1 TsaB [Candidatus Coatesbacteria bacterium]|nr:tRNA (adenosine(37)-N6)-threonylcarbamoyltransferase complex dimerization subunit type 1 TsaB [Candidatus Coatesbacteria bacterium]